MKKTFIFSNVLPMPIIKLPFLIKGYIKLLPCNLKSVLTVW